MIDKKNTLILVALEQELPKSYLPGWRIIYTGVGKVNASFSISRSYFDYKPKYVVNYGTAGSLNKNISGLIEVSKFYQRVCIAILVKVPDGSQDTCFAGALEFGVQISILAYRHMPHGFDNAVYENRGLKSLRKKKWAFGRAIFTSPKR